MKKEKTFVYFVATSDRSRIKIGCSYDPVSRLSTLLTWSPLPLDILAAVPGNQHDERAVHRQYLSLHSHREWFRTSPEMLSEIAAIAQAGRLPKALRGKPGQKAGIPRPLGVKATPEWRAMMSKRLKARWEEKKRNRALVQQYGVFLKANKLTSKKFNRLFGSEVAGTRNDGTHYIFSYEEQYARISAFMENYGAIRSEAA